VPRGRPDQILVLVLHFDPATRGRVQK
jgi:hypothetical protein